MNSQKLIFHKEKIEIDTHISCLKNIIPQSKIDIFIISNKAFFFKFYYSDSEIYKISKNKKISELLTNLKFISDFRDSIKKYDEVYIYLTEKYNIIKNKILDLSKKIIINDQ